MEAGEDVFAVAVRYPYAFVSNREQSYATIASEGDVNGSARTVSYGIRKEIFQHLLHCHRIALSGYLFFYGLANGAAGALSQRHHVHHNLPNERGQVHPGYLQPQITGAYARDFQKNPRPPEIGIDQPFESFKVLDDRSQSALGRFRYL
jgi:hypothetical protein